MRKRENIFSLTKKDFRWDYYKGSGAGGQKRNKTENCCRCTHPDSGAVGKSEEGRSKEKNRKMAFRRMAETIEFQQWVKIEACRKTGIIDQIKTNIERELLHDTKVEVRVNGKWTEAEDSTSLSEAMFCQEEDWQN